MKTLNIMYQAARADFLERIRGKGILVAIMLTMYVSYLFVPSNTANYATIVLGDQRLSYTSAGIGLMFGLTISLFVSLFAFYLVKNAIRRDWDTHVGQIIATTPTSTTTYLIAKWASNLAVLAVILIVMTVMAPMMQLLRGESNAIHLWQIVKPIWFIGLPVMSIIAGMAVLFESIRFLRGGFGNIAYFFVYVVAVVGMGVMVLEAGGDVPDPYGIAHPLSQIHAQEYAKNPDYIPDLTLARTIVDENGQPKEIGVREWNSNSWSVGAIIARVVWLFVGMGIAAGSSLFFDRFNPANVRQKKETWLDRLWQSVQGMVRHKRQPLGADETIQLTPLSMRTRRVRLGSVLLAELRLTLKGQPWWWFAGLAGMVIMGLNTPIEQSYNVVYAAIWPVLVWSALGTREKQYGTGSFIYTTPHPLLNQLPAVWFSGVVVALMAMSGFLFRAIMNGSVVGVAGIISAVLFIPALAVMLGVWSGTSRVFEITYLFAWYVAINLPLEGNLFQLVPVSSVPMIPIYLAGTIVLLALSMVGQKRMVSH